MDSVKLKKIEPYTHEVPLFATALVISLMVWVVLIYATKGMVLFVIPVLFIAYLFVQSRFVSYLKGTGALVSSQQFVELQRQVDECAQTVGLKSSPAVYVLHMNGMFNAFALKFLRKNYIVLLSDIVDALENHPDALRFYIGHEMGHLHRQHTTWEIVLAPALILPLLGSAYSRSREYTCDQYGHACCQDAASSRFGLAALAVGGRKFSQMSGDAYLEQVQDTKGFWMSFHELVSNYPWLVKRYARVSGDRKTEEMIPNRNFLAYFLAIFIPRFSIVSFIVLYAVIIVTTTQGAMRNLEQKQDVVAEQGLEQGYDSDRAVEQDAPVYEAGKVYDNGQGDMYEFLGGDPNLDSSWRYIENAVKE